MGFYATDTRPAVEDLPPKNRVMGSRRSAATRARFAAPEPVDLHQETRDTSTKTVSGLVCWLSRDPIEELGGLHLYAFALNDPINAYDPEGLKGCCGPDNTAGLDAALQQAESRFNSASLFGKVKGCFYMFINPVTAMAAWDLSFTAGGSGQGCEDTITVKGGCYHPWEVNYALYGRGAKLCKAFFFQARNQAWLYKMTIKALANIITGDHPGGWYGTPESVFEWSPQVSGWSKYGYDGTVPPPPDRSKDCQTSSEAGTVTLDEWPW